MTSNGASVVAVAAASVVVSLMVLGSITRTKKRSAPGLGGVPPAQLPWLAWPVLPMIETPPRGSYQTQSPDWKPWPPPNVMVSVSGSTPLMSISEPSRIRFVPASSTV